jgi:hypothetical protein
MAWGYAETRRHNKCFSFHNKIHSFLAFRRGYVPRPLSKTKIREKLSPPTQKNNVLICFRVILLFSETLRWEIILFFPSDPWTPCGMIPTPFRVVEQSWCSYTLKGPSNVFLFFGGRRGGPWLYESRKARYECTAMDWRCVIHNKHRMQNG